MAGLKTSMDIWLCGHMPCRTPHEVYAHAYARAHTTLAQPSHLQVRASRNRSTPVNISGIRRVYYISHTHRLCLRPCCLSRMALWHLRHVLRCVQAGAASPARCNAGKLSLEFCCTRKQSPFSWNQSRLVQTGLPLDTGRPRLVILGTGWAAARLARDIDTGLYDLTVRNTHCGLSLCATVEAKRWASWVA